MKTWRCAQLAGTFLLLLLCFQNCDQNSFSVAPKIGDSAPPPTGSQTISNDGVKYLLFQSFLSGMQEDGTDPRGLVPLKDFQSQLNSGLTEYINKVQSVIKPGTITIAANRKYGIAYGPLPLDLSDQDMSAIIKVGFDIAISNRVPVAFHFDVSHFWKYAKNSDGTLLSTGDANKEWKDFSGTVADGDHWQPHLLPSMCFECLQVKALVDRVAEKVIAPALKGGITRLKTAGDESLFAGVIIGWEAGSDNQIAYHSLKLKGYDSSTQPATLNKATQQVLHDYLVRWTKPLAVTGGVPKEKIYTHTTHLTQFQVDAKHADLLKVLGTERAVTDWWLTFTSNGPDSFWLPFNEYANGGFSIYPNDYDEGVFEAAAAAAARAGSGWGMCEGTNSTIEGKPSELNWETYLGKIFNHGGTLAALFGLVDASTSAEGYGKSTESAEAILAYRKFLSGEKLVESGPVTVASPTPTPTATVASCPSPLPSAAPASLITACEKLLAAGKADTIEYPVGPISDVGMLNTVITDQISAGNYSNAEAIIQLALSSVK